MFEDEVRQIFRNRKFESANNYGEGTLSESVVRSSNNKSPRDIQKGSGSSFNIGVLVGHKTIRFFEMKDLGELWLRKDFVEVDFPVSNFFVD